VSTVQESEPGLASALAGAFDGLDGLLKRDAAPLNVREVGRVTRVGNGVAFVDGLPGVQSEELLCFPGNRLGMALNLEPGLVGVVLLDSTNDVDAGDTVQRTGRVMDVPVGDGLLGRVIDATGRPLDDAGPVRSVGRLPIEREAPPIMHRAPVRTPLQTGIKAIDALIPIGRGQRELILGDRQTGKTTIAVDAIINQREYGVLCIYCAVGQRSSAVARVIGELREHGALEYTAVVVTRGEDPAGLQFVAPYAATTIAEHFMSQGRDVLVVYDDLTHHARAYRELSLLLRRPPGREAFPGDIFYIHSRLLERATHLRAEHGGGSLTALPIIETQAENMAAYIPTNLIGITDGQIYLSPRLFQQGILPAVDVGRSVSRVGGKAQLPAYRSVAGDLKLSYAQFEELERFSRYGTRLEEEKRRTLERGRRVRECLKQPPYAPHTPGEQMAVLLAVTEGLLDDLSIEDAAEAHDAIRAAVREGAAESVRSRASDKPNASSAVERIHGGEKLDDRDRAALREIGKEAVRIVTARAGDGND